LRDAHFSVVSRILEKSVYTEAGFTCAQEIVDALNKSNLYLKEDKLANNIASSISIAVYFNPPMNEIINKNRRIVNNLDCYYNLRNIEENGGYKLYSSIFSDCDTLTPIESTIEKKKTHFKMNKDPKENRVVEVPNDLENSIIEKNLTSKRNRIASIASQPKKFKFDSELLPCDSSELETTGHSVFTSLKTTTFINSSKKPTIPRNIFLSKQINNTTKPNLKVSNVCRISNVANQSKISKVATNPSSPGCIELIKKSLSKIKVFKSKSNKRKNDCKSAEKTTQFINQEESNNGLCLNYNLFFWKIIVNLTLI
jgi:hypothetical protein